MDSRIVSWGVFVRAEELLEKKNTIKTDSYSGKGFEHLFNYSPHCSDITLVDFLHQTLQSQTIPELVDYFLKYLSKFGLDRVVMSEMSYDGTHQKEKHHGILVNFPEEWMSHYLANHYIEHDAVYSAALTARRPFLWSSLKESSRTSQQGKLILEEAGEFKLLDGIGLSIHQPLGEIIGMGLASSSGGVEPNPKMMTEIYAAAHQFYLIFSELSENKTEPKTIPLSQKELEVVLWLAQGKTVAEIAVIIGVTEATIKFHCSNIYSKFGVNNCKSAVIKALRMGLIKPFF